jgi:putative ABC transport system permease protein
MIASDIKFSLRSITRNKLQSAISILGLGIGLGCIILLLALILHETSFNKFIPDSKNVYRVVLGQSGLTHYPLAENMKSDFPEVKEYFRYYQTYNMQLRTSKNEKFRDSNFGYADSTIFRTLGITFISGTYSNSASEVAISENTAIKYFGNLSPLGEVLSVKMNNDFIDLTVSGVYKNFPSTSTLCPDYVADIKLSERMYRLFQNFLGDFGNETNTNLNWTNGEFLTFVILDKNADKVNLSLKMEKYRALINSEQLKDAKFSFQPVTDLYLNPDNAGGRSYMRQGNSDELIYYEAISFLILLISAINYILLTRAGTADRLRELGTRKVFGASQETLRKQIILEANLIAVLSLVPAFFVIDYGMTFINNTLNKTLSAEIFTNPFMWLLLLFVVLFTGSISGFLIGYNFSRVSPIMLLSGKSSEYSRSGRWNNSFLIFHFAIYIILVVSVISVSKQIKYSLTGFRGIETENILISYLTSPELKKSFPAICDEIKKIPGVQQAAGSSFIPPMDAMLPINLAVAEGGKIRFDGLIMGEGMTDLLGIEIIDGTSFGMYQQTAAPDVLINETCALEHKIKAGEKFLNVFTVRGIVKDFNAHSMHIQIQPLIILQQNPAKMALLAIKTDGKNDEAVKTRLRELYAEISPDEMLEIRYLKDQVINFYGNEQNQSRIIGAFSILATVLSIMGLFGIALLSIAKRTKEVGIRKVNGASISEVLYLLNKDFVKWVLVSVVIAIPVSVYLMKEWLERFAYKTELSWWIFAIGAISAVIIALLTVSWHSWRAATRNPVEALRYE